jgi:membrane protease YdiL (CAAX protease family)
MSVSNLVQKAKTAAKAVAIVLAVFLTISYVISLALGPVLFFSTADGLSVGVRRIHQLPIDIFMAITIPIPLGVSFGGLFAGIWVVFVICLVFAVFSRGGFLRSAREVLAKSLSLAKANFLIIMPLVTTGLLYATILIQQFQESQGVQTGSLSFPPSTSPYVILVNLAFAPLREEFAFRITSIGIPLGIFLLYVYRSDSRVSGLKNKAKLILLAMVSPNRAKAKLGYRNVGQNGFPWGISPLEWSLILLTALVFGLAHYLLGGGWEPGKISTAFLAGLAFGIMYVAYGVYAPILLHWFFNYYFTVLDMADSTYGGPVFHGFTNLVEFTNLAAGQVILVVFLLVSAMKIANFLSMKATGLGDKST